MAPEYFALDLVGERAATLLSRDVYAFGIVLNETLTGRPYFETQIAGLRLKPDQFKEKVKDGSMRPQPVHEGPLGALARRCWDSKPLKRPTMLIVLQELEG